MTKERKAYSKAWYEANSEKMKARNKAYRKANPEKCKALEKAWRKANPERRKAYYEANPEKEKARNKAYREANPEKCKAINKSNIEELKDCYIADLLNIPVATLQHVPELIELKRTHIKLKRKIYENQRITA